jgi:hypothetical protein
MTDERPSASAATPPQRPPARRWWTRTEVVVILYALLASALWTMWALGLLGGWVPGRLTRADESVYRDSVDGWSCHLADRCRPETRWPDDPVPFAPGPEVGTDVQIECTFGNHYRIHTGGVAGWVGRSAVVAEERPRGCSALQW